MSGISSVGTPNLTTAQNTSASNTEVANDKTIKAIEENSKTAKMCAAVAIGTSCATLLPLSVLAIKTGKISKAVEGLRNDAKPVIDGVKNITDNVETASGALKETTSNLGNKAKEIIELVKSDDMKNFISQLETKVKELNLTGAGDELRNSIKTISEAAKNKLGDINLEDAANAFIANLGTYVEKMNIPELSQKFKTLIDKFGNIIDAAAGAIK